MNSPVPSPVVPPRDIIDRETQKVVGYACRACGMLFVIAKGSAPEHAEQQRQEAIRHCNRFCTCGAKIDTPYTLRCPACRDRIHHEQQETKELAAFEKAQKVSIDHYSDPLYWPNGSGDMTGGDGYFTDLDTLLDECEQEEREIPFYAWSCTERPLHISAETVIEHAFDSLEFNGDDADRIAPAARKQLQDFLDVWAKEQKVSCWFPDYSRAIILREPDSAT